MTEPNASPHPVLGGYYAEEKERRGFLQGIFDESARFYNRIDALASFGSGPWYRRWALKRAGLKPGMKMLDVATGTGAVAWPASQLSAPGGMVVGLDPSWGMMQEQVRRQYPTKLAQGFAEHLPFPDATFDFLCMGYAIRHVADLDHTLREYRRVLKPGAPILILDFVRPKGRIAYALGRFYLKTVVPWIVWLTSVNRQATKLMEYCWETVDQCVPPERILAGLGRAGFGEVQTRTYGVCIEYLSHVAPKA
jgi:demethylmenaquinone methyltransferase/2-methoxy-6-polyprenyl-1,4-benzoquinol methylase